MSSLDDALDSDFFNMSNRSMKPNSSFNKVLTDSSDDDSHHHLSRKKRKQSSNDEILLCSAKQTNGFETTKNISQEKNLGASTAKFTTEPKAEKTSNIFMADSGNFTR
jgi:hypothetical protein